MPVPGARGHHIPALKVRLRTNQASVGVSAQTGWDLIAQIQPSVGDDPDRCGNCTFDGQWQHFILAGKFHLELLFRLRP